MREHVLKTLPDYWDAVEVGDKNFEVRRDDRQSRMEVFGIIGSAFNRSAGRCQRSPE